MSIKLLGAPNWTSAGPNPILLQGSSITGAVQTVVGKALGPNAYVLYAGAVNGGVWRADNFTDNMLASRRGTTRHSMARVDRPAAIAIHQLVGPSAQKQTDDSHPIGSTPHAGPPSSV
jgi:hypothetical protein